MRFEKIKILNAVINHLDSPLCPFKMWFKGAPFVKGLYSKKMFFGSSEENHISSKINKTDEDEATNEI